MFTQGRRWVFKQRPKAGNGHIMSDLPREAFSFLDEIDDSVPLDGDPSLMELIALSESEFSYTDVPFTCAKNSDENMDTILLLDDTFGPYNIDYLFFTPTSIADMHHHELVVFLDHQRDWIPQKWKDHYRATFRNDMVELLNCGVKGALHLHGLEPPEEIYLCHECMHVETSWYDIDQHNALFHAVPEEIQIDASDSEQITLDEDELNLIDSYLNDLSE